MAFRITGLESLYRERSPIVDVNQYGAFLSDIEELAHREPFRRAIARVLVALHQMLQRLLHNVLRCVMPHTSARSPDNVMGRV